MVVPFGLTNAPTTSMCLMNNVLRPCLDKFVVVIVDVILVYLKIKEEHEEYLFVVLQLVREHNMYEN